MAISEEVRQLIFILEEEGFGALAGELLTEISLGREVEKEIAPDEQAKRGDEIETVITRIPIEEPEQLREAMSFLRARLVLPIRAFAEAEQIASEFAHQGTVRIRFIDPNERVETTPLSTRDVGDVSVVDKLDALLERLPNMIAPPAIDGV